MLALTDGIIAIAATIMVLQLQIPDQFTLEVIIKQMPLLLAYIISYSQVFLAWHEHHDAFLYANKVDHRLYLLNALWLFFITLLPFTTGVVGRSPHHQPSVLLYIFVLMLTNIILILESHMIEKINKCKINDAAIISVLRKVSFVGYAVAIASSFVEPLVSIILIIISNLTAVAIVIIYDLRKHRVDHWGNSQA